MGMVPAMFHVPISAPTARRMKIAPIAEVTPPMAASRSLAAVYPFLNATSPATIALVSSATCSGPFAASMPNSTIVERQQHDQHHHRDERVEEARRPWP